ncbi:MAG: proton-conducting transporter membrane subunit [Candidatus Bathyarchaeia archaeon]
MIGGETEPIISPESIKVPSAPFNQPLRVFLEPVFRLSEKGGIDILWNGLAKGVYRISEVIALRLSLKVRGLIFIAALAALASSYAWASTPGSTLILAGVLMSVLCGLIAVSQSTLGGVLRWGTLSWVGRVLIELGSGTRLGISGGLLDVINAVMIFSALFFSILAVRRSAGTAAFTGLGGLARRMPVTAGAFLVSGLALAGIPPFSGWWSEYHLFASAVELGRPEVIIASLLSSALTISYIIRAFNLTFYGSGARRGEKGGETVFSVAALVITSVVVAIGVFPDLLMAKIHALVEGWLR